MDNESVRLASLDQISGRVLRHVQEGHHTALVGIPGCGTTTLLHDLQQQMVHSDFEVVPFDLRVLGLPDFLNRLNSLPGCGNRRRVVLVDHATHLLFEDFKVCLDNVQSKARETDSICLWSGSLDARSTDQNLGVRLISVPAAHVFFPVLPRDELLSVYRAIAKKRGCHWGEAVLFLMLDFCGSDLSLVSAATAYFHGDWSDRLYDETVWDRINDWLKNDENVDAYRCRLKSLPQGSKTVLSLVRFGGKPQCLRADVLEEANDALRRLRLDGFLVQNLLPGFYQLRNLTIRFLLDESVRPELLFRRATNERVGQLLQDAETMLRHVLTWAFERLGPAEVRYRLKGMQQPREIISGDLNREILKWAKESCSEQALTTLNSLLLDQRKAFRESNSVWEGVVRMMREDGLDIESESQQFHIQSIDYLMFIDLGALVVALLDTIFPRLVGNDLTQKQVKERWQESLSKIRRLRNQVAHLRNVSFQDMEDLVGTVERMRWDLISYGGWN